MCIYYVYMAMWDNYMCYWITLGNGRKAVWQFLKHTHIDVANPF